MQTAKEWKDKGNGLVKEKKYKEALDCYTKAIEIDPNDPILYSNRSAMHLNLSEFDQALTDAEKAISLKADYAKGYLRKGKALEGLQKMKEALDAYKQGLEKDSQNTQLLEASQQLEASLNNPFLKNYPKLFTDPRTANMMKDPNFKNLIDFAMRDQKVLMQMIQTDPRFMAVFSVLTGIDLEKMSEDVQKESQERKKEEEKKKKEEEEKKKKEEEEKKKKEEEEKYNAMSSEEKKEVDDHKRADEIKAKGNEEFKKRNFDEAIKLYQQAIDIYPKEMIYYLNSAKCYLEKKDYDKAIEHAAALASSDAKEALAKSLQDPLTNGALVLKNYGVKGATGHAAAGFPDAVYCAERLIHHSKQFEEPKALASVMKSGPGVLALCDSMVRLEDTNLLHRGGPEGLAFARERASKIAAMPSLEDRLAALEQLDKEMIEKNLSPGGSADMLALAYLLNTWKNLSKDL